VLSDPKQVAEAVKRGSPDTLVVLDAVCAVASEEIQMDNWGVDVVISASQKGLGAPPGLSVVIASQKAMKVEFCLCQTSLVDVNGLSRYLRHVRSLSPHTMPAGRSKSIRASPRMLCSPL
jgi:aspartate aminotransferase-like enzyme